MSACPRATRGVGERRQFVHCFRKRLISSVYHGELGPQAVQRRSRVVTRVREVCDNKTDTVFCLFRCFLLTVFDAVHVGIKLVDGIHAVLEVAVAHVRVDGRLRLRNSCCQKERLDRPPQVLCTVRRLPHPAGQEKHKRADRRVGCTCHVISETNCRSPSTPKGDDGAMKHLMQ